jgi:predicted outer membrane repeat protein
MRNHIPAGIGSRKPPRQACRLLPLAAAVTLCLAGSGHAATIAVNNASADSVTGQCTLADAVDALNSATAVAGCIAGDGVNDIVDLSFFTSPTTISLALPNSADGLSGIGFSKPASLVGPLDVNGRPLVTIQRSSTSGVNFRVIGTTADLTIQGVTVSGGVSNARGGGIYANTDANLTIGNSVISGNAVVGAGQYYSGGGVSSVNGNITLNNSTVSGNSAPQNGGGIYCKVDGTITLNNSTVSGNFAYDSGGGIYNFAGNVVLNSSTVNGNTAGTVDSGTPHGGNKGGGIFVYRKAILTNSTVTGNSINFFGGGIFAYALQVGRPSRGHGQSQAAHNGTGSVYLSFSTVSGNKVLPNFGSTGGVRATYYLKSVASIISGNDAGDVQAGNSMYDFAGTNNIVSDLPGNAPPDTLSCDPMLAPLANNGGPTMTLALLNGSCAVDAGPATPPAGMTTDQRGLPRPVGSATDIGAVEKQGENDPPDKIFASGFET